MALGVERSPVANGQPKVVNLDAVRRFSALVSRSLLGALAGKTYGGDRDLYKQLGYKRFLDYDDFLQRYERGGIARRIVDASPATTWRAPPSLSGGVRFQKAWTDLVKKHDTFSYFNRMDCVSGIGRYGVLLIGVNDGRALNEPMGRATELLFTSIFGEGHSSIEEYETDPTNPRFGQPTRYKLKLGKDQNSGPSTKFPAEVQVHYSRVLHIADGLTEGDIFGTPRMQPVWNLLDDLDKTVGAGAEAAWKVMDRGIAFVLDPETELPPGGEDAMADEIEEYYHGMRKYLRLRGVEAKVLQSDSVDPRGVFAVTSSLISGTIGIPQRVLFGSERGQLASTQDERNYHARIKERQKNYAEGTIVRPFINLGIEHGFLPRPSAGDYNVIWPDLAAITERERADIAARYGQAIRSVSEQKLEVITPAEFKLRFIDNADPQSPA